MNASSQRIAILSDIHALATTFRAALDAAVDEGFDRMVILGDLLGYGPEVAETLELAQEAQERHDAVLILGNHDQLYLDLDEGRDDYLDGLPDWIVEQALWTRQQLGGRHLSDGLDWSREVQIQQVLIAHANPYSYGDWTYVRDEASARAAAATLHERGFSAGIFGHVHRHRDYAFDGLPRVVTVGSIGQPRTAGQSVPQWAMATIGDGIFEVAPRPVAFDAALYASMLARTSLSAPTRAKLESFFA